MQNVLKPKKTLRSHQLALAVCWVVPANTSLEPSSLHTVPIPVLASTQHILTASAQPWYHQSRPQSNDLMCLAMITI